MSKLYYNILVRLYLFLIGGITYYLIEIMYRGYSFVSMMILGGICFLFIGDINERFLPWESSFLYQVFLGTVFVAMMEFSFGVVLNLILGLNIWDYSNLPFNILGQICPQFILAWIPIIAFAILLDDWLKYLFLHGEKPRYRLL